MFTLAAFKGGHGLAEVPGVRRGARQEVLVARGWVWSFDGRDYALVLLCEAWGCLAHGPRS